MPYYHVRISVRDERHDEVKTDLDAETLEQQILEPYRKSSPITINGKVLPLDAVSRIRISKSEEPSASIVERLRSRDRNSQVVRLGGPGYQWRAAGAATDVTDEYIAGPPGADLVVSSANALETSPDGAEQPPADRRTVFIVAGRDQAAVGAVVATLRALGLRIVEWEHAVAKTGLPNPYVGDVVEAGLRMADAVVVILTPDDVVRLRDDLTRDDDGPEERDVSMQARPNVYYEAGIADTLGRDRTVILEVGKVKPFSDASGRHVVRYDGSSGRRNVLAERLRVAGLVVDTSGEDWLHVGELTDVLHAAESAFERTVTMESPSVVDKERLIAQIDGLVNQLAGMKSRSLHDDLSDLEDESLDFVMGSQAVLDGFAPDSSYAREAEAVLSEPPHLRIPVLAAALRALRAELD